MPARCRRYPPCCRKGGKGEASSGAVATLEEERCAKGAGCAGGVYSTCHADSKRNFHSYAGLHPRSLALGEKKREFCDRRIRRKE